MSNAVGDIPFEFVGEVLCAGAVAEAGDVECSAASRHCRVTKMATRKR